MSLWRCFDGCFTGGYFDGTLLGGCRGNLGRLFGEVGYSVVYNFVVDVVESESHEFDFQQHI